MNREIKFRAWQKHHKRMLEVVRIDFETEKVTADYGKNRAPRINTFELENFELMQFTGLHDKNGKEIYEGDICETVSYSGSPAGTIDVVVYSKGSFKLTDLEELLLPIYFDDSDLKSVEVIGNIYENPELLETS